MAVVLIAAALAAAVARPAADRPADGSSLDVQAHRGGLGLRPESSLAAFTNALQLGVTTLELDVQITEDGRAVVTHDRRANPVVCRDTDPAVPGDAEFPYVGKLVKDLTVAQLSMLDCGTRRPDDPRVDPVVDTQIPVPGARIVQLDDVFALVHKVGAGGEHGVRLNVETKVEAGAPGETAPREQFVQLTVDAVRQAGLIENVSVQSFDWGAVKRVREIEPRLVIVALVDPALLQVGRPGASPWLGGIDIDDFGGDPVRAAASFDADAISPVLDAGYRPYTTVEMVDAAHAAGMRVIPWTVNDIATMEPERHARRRDYHRLPGPAAGPPPGARNRSSQELRGTGLNRLRTEPPVAFALPMAVPSASANTA
jgi:glycerophosphoryl diester phosphodiesterase